MAKVQFGFASANALNTRQILPLLLTGFLVWGTGAIGHNFHQVSLGASSPIVGPIIATAQVKVQVAEAAKPSLPSTDVDSADELGKPVQALEAVGAMAAAVIAPASEHLERQVELGSGETFSNMLADADVEDADASAVVKVINEVYKNRRLPTGQEFTLGFLRRGTDESLESVTFQPEPTKEVSIQRLADGTWTGKVETTPLERQRLAMQVDIKSSLREAGRRAGIPANIMAALTRVYSHSVDFQRDVRPGDRFEVLYDQPISKTGKPIGEGTIIYAALQVSGKIKPLYRVTFGDGTVDYFDAEGQSIKRALLRTPVDGAHMTSGYGMRVHPLLGYSKMHKGVDFGAPPGTPILAAGSGVVEEVGFKGAYGRYVRLRHNGKTQTAYAHMSRFARNLYNGARVNQGDVIGFVGASGRATGPHLHFEVLMNGDQVNPTNISLPMGRVLEGPALNQFRQGEKRIRQEFVRILGKTAATAAAQPAATQQPAPRAEAQPAGKPTPISQVKLASAAPNT